MSKTNWFCSVSVDGDIQNRRHVTIKARWKWLARIKARRYFRKRGHRKIKVLRIKECTYDI